MDWPLLFALDRAASSPLFAQLANAVADGVRRGRLRPGEDLPGSRTLAKSLGVHRNTVVAAYRELESQGWVEVHARRTLVATRLPSTKRIQVSRALASRTGFSVDRVRIRRSLRCEVPFDLGGGLPDPRVVPRKLLARALGRVVRQPGSRTLEYGDPRGHPRLREQVATMLARTRGLTVQAQDILITRGSQMALALVARALLRPGDEVAVERLGYAPAWDAFEHAGATLRGIDVDDAGLVVEQLEGTSPRAVYLTPHHQYPTTVTLDASRRLHLLTWAAKERVAVIEDDYDSEYHYDAQPVHPLAAHDPRGVVVYIGTLSKVLAPGIRIGWVVAPPNLQAALLGLRTTLDGQGSLAFEAAVADLLEDREVQRHIWRTRRLYAERRDALCDALRRRLRGALEFSVPAGGLALWAAVTAGVSADQWAEQALERGVRVSPGRCFTLERRAAPNLRIGFARHTPDELCSAVEHLVSTCPASGSKTSR
ncbi:MAG: PLP-dependent aminotransferase family protein [Nannocystaceae bacterium]|nr:PLP-dependent aminotransferase family protein [Nannocystaceae bacterium]